MTLMEKRKKIVEIPLMCFTLLYFLLSCIAFYLFFILVRRTNKYNKRADIVLGKRY